MLRSAVTSRVIAGVSALALAAGLSACSGESDESSQAPPKPTVMTLDESTPVAVEGDDYRVTGTVLTRLGDRTAGFQGWADDGTEIYMRTGTRFRNPEEPGSYDSRQGALVARDPGSGRTRILTDRPRRQDAAQANDPSRHLGHSAVDIDGQRLMWVESQFHATDGTLYTYDLATDRETAIVGAKTTDVRAHSYGGQVVRGDRVYFIGYAAGDTEGPTSLFEVPLDGGAEPTEIVPDATEVYEGPDGLIEVGFWNRLVRWDPAKGADGELQDTSVTSRESFANAAGVRMHHAEVEDEPLVVESPEHGRFEIALGDRSSEYLVATERWAAFSTSTPDGTGAFLLDMARGELRRLEGAQIPGRGSTDDPATYVYRVERADDGLPTSRRVITLPDVK